MQHDLEQLQQLLDGMPPVVAMGIRAVSLTQGQLRLHAPLQANLNDKGNAFGGSLASIMTLAGWGLVTATLQQAGRAAEVYVADSQLRYLTPLYGDLQAVAGLAEASDWTRFLERLDERGHASIQLQATVQDADGKAAAALEGRFVARLKDVP